MQNFDYYNPTHIIFGKGRIADLDKQVPANARVLITYGGGSVRKNGTLDEVKAALGQRHVLEFSGIEPNPAYETLLPAVELVRREKIDFLLAVGGGSVIDGTKFIAAAACYAGDPWEILTSHGAKVTGALPLGTVLTLPATGSEMNNGAVVTRKELKAKLPFLHPAVYPRFSVLDPTKTFTLPPRQIANGVVDAFVHVMEQYLTYPVNSPVQDRFAESLLQTLVEIGPQALANPQDYDIRANVMWTATLALNGLIACGVPQDWATHMIGHELTALYGMDHGQTLAVVLPAMMDERRQAKEAKLLQYGERVWGIREGSVAARIDAAIAKTREFFEAMGTKTRLADYGVGQDGVDQVIAQLQTHGMTALGETREVTPEVSRRVLERSL
ncbi:iron-containing alcohol dehydrogenase [Azospira inquinata]|uniref:Iron-containing alcohol dehydrogenase n=1 Tax=Azospira inquinata TaxID=2785627 RepID=A0A975SM56_9RHOO|nr:iron-containing alcohol dehydrogenase [Azospira inquinata]QWT45780.1 iron-containing alcohol dehydrogenase [Azospira inquinata]QWT48898.1 iron-containing alcohol dehydrogenase [Azospira inquinata]